MSDYPNEIWADVDCVEADTHPENPKIRGYWYGMVPNSIAVRYVRHDVHDYDQTAFQFITRIRDALGPECYKVMIDDLPEYVRQIVEKERAAPKVKPLVWERGERNQMRAFSVLGEHVITQFGGTWHRGGLAYPNLATAQEEEQANYERRIREALE